MADSDSGYSWQDPDDSDSDFMERQLQINTILARCRTIVMAKVTAVNNPGKGNATTVSAMPLVQIIDGNNQTTSHKPINNIPVHRLGGGSNLVVVDPAVDDIGFLAVCDRDISAVKNAEAEAPPGSRRKFDLADAIYLGVLFKKNPTQYIVMDDNGISISAGDNPVTINGVTFDKDGNIHTSGTFDADGAIASKAEVTALKGALHVNLSTHSHPGNNLPPTKPS
jgi:hypothetical protein